VNWKDLSPLKTSDADVIWLEQDRWHLELSPSPSDQPPAYAVAQLDDYHGMPRSSFAWQPPLTMTMRARVSAENLPGTWGFGFWNDPFSFSLGIGGATRRMPALPNAAWFFYASPPNYLSFRDDLPAQGFLAATFRSPNIPPGLLALAGPGLALGIFPWTAPLLRAILRRFIRQDAALIPALALTDWHTYQIYWERESVIFTVDEQEIFNTPTVPLGRLGLVLWIDNQFAAFPPGGRIAFGSLPRPQTAFLELADLTWS